MSGRTEGAVVTPPDGVPGGSPLLVVDDLHVEFAGRRRLLRSGAPPVRAVNGVSFEVRAGKTFGLVGESGSGKSTVARAILDLVIPTGGRILLDGREVAGLSGGELLRYRKQVQAVLQDPYSSLNPVHDVSVIVGDAVTRHRSIPRGPARDQAVVQLLDEVGLSSEMLGRQPHELSGGQRQRVSIARALAVQPELIVADEPTSALDVSVQSQVINLLSRIQRQVGVAFLVIAHDLEVIKHMSHDVGVMYLGSLVETGPSEAVYAAPTHPYTMMLIASVPVPDPAVQATRRDLRRSFVVAEAPAGAGEPARGCPFASRCPLAFEPCTTEMPEPTPAHGNGTVRCHLHTAGPMLGGQSVGPHLLQRIGAQRTQSGSGAPLARETSSQPLGVPKS